MTPLIMRRSVGKARSVSIRMRLIERRLRVESTEAMSPIVIRATSSVSMMPGAGAFRTGMGWSHAVKLRRMSAMTMMLQIMMSRRMILSALFRCAAPEKAPESAKETRLLVFGVIIVVTVML